MCGICGYIGQKPALPALLDALGKLEYRGYDSAGIALVETGSLFVQKSKGRLSLLRERLTGCDKKSTLGIGHTRWATHGEPSDINSHPHVSGRIAVVHNGIIENYARLKKWLQEREVIFESDTDTEVAAHLINYYYTLQARENPGKKPSFVSAFSEAVKRLEGSYALAVLCADYPDRIISFRKDSPLVIGLGSDENIVASDVPALLSHTRDVLYMEENETAVLFRDHVDIFSAEGEKVIRESTRIDWDEQSAEKGGYAHFMNKEIHEQPKAFSDTLQSRLKKNNDALEINFDEVTIDDSWINAPRIIITACGTAFHAAMVGKYAFEHFARIPVEVDIASEYRYRNPIIDKNDIFIVISQSGETADTLAAMRLAKSRGLSVFALTNVVGSTLAREADNVLYTRAGPEIAVASTKAFTTQLICLYMLALKLGVLRKTIDEKKVQYYLHALEQISAQAKKLLEDEKKIQKFAAQQFNKTKVFFMGRQFDYAVSMESALKLKEISYTHSEAFAAGELKHGAIALVDESTLVVAIATQNELFDKIISNIREVSSRGASSLVITWEGEEAFNSVAGEIFTIPKTAKELSPILSVIPTQLFAYYCAVQRGNDPDKPRNLAKSVTVE
jgi:glucosamine--fructose-6-phosphate aminotransferase (isomerizing)